GKPAMDYIEATIAADCDSAACLLRNGTIKPRPRPAVTMGYTEKVQIGCGNLYITVNYDENGVCEVFTNTGRAGGCPSQSEATARLVSIALRSGVDGDELIRQLKGIRCPSCLRQKGVAVTSCPDAIAKAIERVVKVSKDGAVPSAAAVQPIQPDMTPAEAKLAKFCPECGAPLEHEGGCVTCRNCGYSKCG
ncbi:MAG: TSCPD domain-containing protein, partial [Pseudoflavonifractor sp.]